MTSSRSQATKRQNGPLGLEIEDQLPFNKHGELTVRHLVLSAPNRQGRMGQPVIDRVLLDYV
ncbi:hypothetical protein Pan54_24760 [Rubinisphaera italica]|uniref:Uncharacterized protein n=1 Tax=Rubinisphaera italica TaxID=2527969 RepID=A0A5C5XGD4_9PLAN|nr:hypothetical protein Pan54_24760 [Rubinisphaera italica]